MANRVFRNLRDQLSFSIATLLIVWSSLSGESAVMAQSRYASSDSLSGFVHWIDLYDANNTRIDPSAENPKPYSPAKTCGRCHDFNSISHGWHFNATVSDAEHGRPGQPWIWSDPRTGTHLPLSYRNWNGTQNPDKLGLTRWQVAAKLGGFLPGGGPGSEESLSASVAPQEDSSLEPVDRKAITGPLPVDCMMCHHNQGSGYSPFVWTEQIEDENFAYAPSAAVGIATVSGSMGRLKDDFDPSAEDAASKLPKIEYEQSRFRGDGKIFFDLVRKPKSDACYYCHSNITADSVTGSRWLHDDDVHLRAGFECADCHRNGIDHNTVRGFEGEQHSGGTAIASLSCQGCHVGNQQGTTEAFGAAGRLGAPLPAHQGLPPLHFEKLTCTACHSGPPAAEDVGRQLNSIAHRLGAHEKRTGDEYPGIVGAIAIPVDYTGSDATGELADAETHQKYTPHRLMWPSYWGTLTDQKITALNPEEAYELVRRPLKVRREFTEELSEVKLSLSERTELIGADRARLKEEDWTEEEKAKISEAQSKARTVQVGERMAAAMAEIEEAYPNTQAVYVSGGAGFVRDGEDKIKALDPEQLGDYAEPYAWPLAHNVRPARQSLGATGCAECHNDNSLFFAANVTPVGLLPDQKTVAVKAQVIQGADMVRLSYWNQLFLGRSLFKILGLVALALTSIVTLSAIAVNLGRR